MGPERCLDRSVDISGLPSSVGGRFARVCLVWWCASWNRRGALARAWNRLRALARALKTLSRGSRTRLEMEQTSVFSLESSDSLPLPSLRSRGPVVRRHGVVEHECAGVGGGVGDERVSDHRREDRED